MINAAKMITDLRNYLDQLLSSELDPARKEALEPLINYLRKRNKAQLNFICTHNSRRSQMAQVWAQVAADYYHYDLTSYSGGIEVTACNERTVAALERAGLKTLSAEGEINPLYKLSYSEDKASIALSSKLFDDSINPSSDFAAVMTCSHAEENCPFVAGADQRIALTYEDPKAFDDSPEEAQAYDRRCAQIAREMFYVFKTAQNGN